MIATHTTPLDEKLGISEIAIVAHIFFTSCHSSTCHGETWLWQATKSDGWNVCVWSHSPTAVHPLNYHLISRRLLCVALSLTCKELLRIVSTEIELTSMSRVEASHRGLDIAIHKKKLNHIMRCVCDMFKCLDRYLFNLINGMLDNTF